MEQTTAPVVEVENHLEEVQSTVNIVFENIKASIVGKSFNVTTFMLLIPRCMEAVEDFPELTGAEKKALVLDVLSKLIDEIPLKDEDRALLKTLILNVIPTVIDTVVASSLGQFALNIYEEVEEEVKAHCGPCFKKQTQTAKAKSLRRQSKHVYRNK